MCTNQYCVPSSLCLHCLYFICVHHHYLDLLCKLWKNVGCHAFGRLRDAMTLNCYNWKSSRGQSSFFFRSGFMNSTVNSELHSVSHCEWRRNLRLNCICEHALIFRILKITGTSRKVWKVITDLVIHVMIIASGMNIMFCFVSLMMERNIHQNTSSVIRMCLNFSFYWRMLKQGLHVNQEQLWVVLLSP